MAADAGDEGRRRMIMKPQAGTIEPRDTAAGPARPNATNALVTTAPATLPGPPAPRPAPPPPGRWRRWGLWIGLAVAGGIGGWLYHAQPWQPVVPAVAVEVLAPGPVTRVLAVNGRIAAARSVVVKPSVAGTLLAPLADEGDEVASGAPLARIDDTSQQAALRQTVAALDQALVAQAQARAALDRAEALAANVSRVTLDDARRALDRAEQEAGRLRAAVEQAQFQLTRYVVPAPFSGTVLTRSVEPGQVVDPATPLFRLADLSTLLVEANVDESLATQIRVGMPALLQLTGANRTLPGRVSFVAPLVDADTGGLLVKIAFEEPQTAPVGLSVTANIVVDQRTQAISVPRTAIVATGQDRSVFVLSDDGTARAVPVTVIDWPADRLIVTDGLSSGDRLIADAEGLADGLPVTATVP